MKIFQAKFRKGRTSGDWDLRSSGILRRFDRWFCTDVSGQPIRPISRVMKSKKKALLGLHDPWRWDQWVVPRRRYRTTTQRWVISQKSAYLIIYIAAEPKITLKAILPTRDNLTDKRWTDSDVMWTSLAQYNGYPIGKYKFIKWHAKLRDFLNASNFVDESPCSEVNSPFVQTGSV
jgi:hypothetical protein